MEKINFRLATREDNQGLLDLAHAVSMSGDIEIVFERNPNFFYACEIQGFSYQVLVATRSDNTICASGVRVLKSAYINGNPMEIGYLGDLKVSSKARKLRILSNGYQKMKKLHQDGQAMLHITAIIDDNKDAKAALVWKNKDQSIPNYYDLGRINTYFVFPFLPRFLLNMPKIVRGNREIIDNIVSFLNAEGMKKQFFPVYTREYFLNLRQFNVSDFYVAYEGDQIVGVVATWDQSSFRQTLLKKYHGSMTWIKRILGSLLPQEGERIKHLYVSFVTVKDNSSRILAALLHYVYADIRKVGYKYFVLGLHEQDALNKALRGVSSIVYKSRLYVAEYKSDDEIRRLLDNRVPYVEVATL
ncbi:MAG: hypothetical protein HQL22_11200 [Candidatus Omnitrophica bacterium]|nr:hypothetical protein [Candidatus Omnitrophota bacterium]